MAEKTEKKDVNTKEKIDVKTESAPSTSVNIDDNILNAISYVLTFIVPIFGSLVIWLLYKDKSKSVNFQAMQATIFQTSIMVFGLGFTVISSILSVVTFGLFTIIMIPSLFLIMGLFIIYTLYAAYQCYQKQEFRIPLIADLVETKILKIK